MAVWLQRHEAIWLQESYLIWVEKRLEMLMKAGKVNVIEEEEEDVEVEHDQVQLDVTQRDFNITQPRGEARASSNLNLPHIPLAYSFEKSPLQKSFSWKTHGKIQHHQLPSRPNIFPLSHFAGYYNNTKSS